MLVAGSLRNGQFSRRERSIHRSKKTLNSTSCLVHSLITHARSRLGHPWLNWLPESGRVKREHVEGRRKLAEGTVNRRREFFESRSKARSHPRASERTSRVEPSRAGWPVNGRGKKEGHDRVIVIFSDRGSRWFTRKYPITALTIANHDTPPCALTGG